MKIIKLVFFLCSWFITTVSVNAQRTIVTIGDSNGANEDGWVNQLKSIRPQDSILNYSISGEYHWI